MCSYKVRKTVRSSIPVYLLVSKALSGFGGNTQITAVRALRAPRWALPAPLRVADNRNKKWGRRGPQFVQEVPEIISLNILRVERGTGGDTGITKGD